MASVIAPRPNLRSLAPARPAGVRAPLRVIQGGRAGARRRQAVLYRRRRAAALLVVAAVAVVMYLALLGVSSLLPGDAVSGDAVSDAAGSAPASVAVPVAGSPAGEATYAVRPGDTVWSIARSLHPQGDIRPIVDELVDRAGGASLRVGQRLALDDLVG